MEQPSSTVTDFSSSAKKARRQAPTWQQTMVARSAYTAQSRVTVKTRAGEGAEGGKLRAISDGIFPELLNS